MPIFEYQCPACSRRFEHLHSSRHDHVPPCPHCGAAAVRRVLSVFAVGRSGHAPPAACGRDDCACRGDGI